MIGDQELDKRFLILKIIWFAMLMSLAVYLLLGLYAGSKFGPLMEEDTFGMVRIFLYIVSFITLIAIRYVRKLFGAGKGQYGQSGQILQRSTFQSYMAATVVALAMSESIAIYGVVLFFLGKNQRDLYLLVVISAVSMFMYRPRRDEGAILTRDGRGDSGPGGTIR